MTFGCNLLDRLLGAERLTGDLILAEVLQGFRTEIGFRRALDLLGTLEFHHSPAVKSLSARREIYRTLRNEGITVRKTIDGLIATFCIDNHHTLLHF